MNEITFQVFLAIETELRHHLKSENTPNFNKWKMRMWPFYWSILSAEWDESDSQALFELVVNLFLTIRGFSYASTCIRMHKNIAGNTFLCSCRYRMISMNWSSLFPMQRLLESSRWNKCNTCEMLPSVEWRDASEGVSA